MLVLSQDKKHIANVESMQEIICVDCREYWDISIVYYNRFIKLGKYANEERAKEVLELILENYNYITRGLADMNGGNSRMFTCYFKMPKE